jgi:hypothetical protein
MSTDNGKSEVRTIAVPKSGEVARQEFGASQLSRSGETASSAVAAQARAMIEARYIMAMQRPRDLDMARVKLLAACSRSRFAEVARYIKPIGDGIEGPSIRLAEEAARCLTNIAMDVVTIYDDAQRRIIRATATDLESNIPWSKDVTIEKTVERSYVKDGQTVVSQRINSKGKAVYVVLATDDEILNKENALASKAMRGNLLRLVPGDLLEEAMDTVYRTLNADAEKDPGAERKRVIDAFASLNIMPTHLKEYLGHDLDVTTPAELIALRSIYTAMKDGEATWADIIETRQREKSKDKPAPQAGEGEGTPAVTPKGKANLGDLAADSKAKREEAKGASPAASKGQASLPVGKVTRGASVKLADGTTVDLSDEDAIARSAVAPTAAEVAANGPPPIREPGDDSDE